MEVKQHTISVMVENKFGVLARIAGLFSGRGYNIDSLTVNHTNDAEVSKMTIVTRGDETVLEQIEKQLKKLVDVIKVTELTGEEFVERELALVKIRATSKSRAELMQIVEICGGKIAIVHKNELGVEISGPAAAIDNFLSLVSDFGIIEVARTGCVAVSRAEGATESHSKL
jgi:acetolactate synthase I/III small subunit